MAVRNVFNAEWYMQQYPDVLEAVLQGLISAEDHFNSFGKSEGRAPSPLFDPAFYLQHNPDIAAAVEAGLITAYDHFENFGVYEFRNPVPYFDVDFYLRQNPDIAAAVEQGLISPIDHFLQFGQTEPRALSPFFDLGAYMAANPDVADAVSTGGMSPLDHLLTFGFKEGRDFGNGVSLAQFQNDPVFLAALSGGGNVFDALERVAEVAPFLPTFRPPAGWEPPASTPIPTDFVPQPGTTLVVPPSVVVPPDVELPDTFEPGAVPQPPAPEPPTPKPTFKVQIDENGILSFGGSAKGAVSMSLSDGTLSFSRGGVTASTRPELKDIVTIEVPAGVNLKADEDLVSQVSHINLKDSAKLTITTKFDPLSPENGPLESANIANVSVDDVFGPKETWDHIFTEGGNLVDKFKLFWVTGDEQYYGLLYPSGEVSPDQVQAVNDANLHLGEIYIEYLENGGEPILDIVQTKVGGTPNFAVRQQSLHDNVLGNLNASAMASRIKANTLTDPKFEPDSSEAKYGARPIYDGRTENTSAKEATIVWDLVNGVPRSDTEDIAGSAYIIRSAGSTDQVLGYGSIQAAVEASANGDTILLGPGEFKEGVLINKDNLSIIFSNGAVVEGGFAVSSGVKGLRISGDGRILDGLQPGIIGGSAGKAIYLQTNADISVEGITVELEGDPAGQQRGIEAEGGGSVIEVKNVEFIGQWLSGIYVNRGNELEVIDSKFIEGGVGIGTDGPKKLVVQGSVFENLQEGIGLTEERILDEVNISENTYDDVVIAIANGGFDTGLTELHGEFIVVVAEGQSVQNAIEVVDSLEGVGQVVLGAGKFEGTWKVNGNLKILGQGDESVLEGSIRINDPSDANKVVSNIRLEGFTVDAPKGIVPIIALSNHDGLYNTESLHILNITVLSEAQHGIGLFDVKDATLKDLKIILRPDGVDSNFYAIEALGLSNANLSDILIEGFAFTEESGSVHVWEGGGYEQNSSIILVNVGDISTHLYPING